MEINTELFRKKTDGLKGAKRNKQDKKGNKKQESENICRNSGESL